MTTRPTLISTPDDAALAKWTRDVERFVEDLIGSSDLPSAPAEVKVVSQANSVKVTFRAVDEVGVSEYKIYRSTDKNFAGGNAEHIATVTQAIDPSGTDLVYIDAEATEKSFYFVSAVKGVRRPRLEGPVSGFGSATEGHAIGEGNAGGGAISGFSGIPGSILFVNEDSLIDQDNDNLFYSQSFKVPVAGLAGISWGPHALPDVFLVRDAAGILAQRRGTNVQAFRVYETFDSGVDERFIEINALGGSGAAEILATTASGSTDIDLIVGTQGDADLRLFRNNLEQVRISDLSTDLGLNNLAFGSAFGVEDTILVRDGAADTLAQKRGSNVQAFRVYESAGSPPPITQTLLTEGSDQSDLTVYTTLSVTLTANRLTLFSVMGADFLDNETISVTSITGGGVTWVKIAENQMDSIATPRNVHALFRASGPTPSPGVLTITFDRQASDVHWSVSEFPNADGSGASGANGIVQFAINESDSATSLIATLAAFASPDNATFGTFAAKQDTSWTEGSGFTKISDLTFAFRSMETQFRDDNDITVDATQGGSAAPMSAIAVEINNIGSVGNRYIELFGIGASGGAEVMAVTASGATDRELIVGTRGDEDLRLFRNNIEQVRITDTSTDLGPNRLAFGSAFGVEDVILEREAADVLALRRGTAASVKEFRVYMANDPGVDVRYLRLGPLDASDSFYVLTGRDAGSSNAQLVLGTGAGTQNDIRFTPNNTLAWVIQGATGAHHLKPSAGLTDIGNPGGSAQSVRTLHMGGGAETPIIALNLETQGLVGAGTRDSHSILQQGGAFDSSAHEADWKTFIEMTSQAGASTWHLQTRIDVAAFADVLTITDAGIFGIPGGFEGPIVIDGISDAVQLLVRGHSTQTSDIMLVEDDANAKRFSVDDDGVVRAEGTFGIALQPNQVGGVVGATLHMGTLPLTPGTDTYVVSKVVGVALFNGETLARIDINGSPSASWSTSTNISFVTTIYGGSSNAPGISNAATSRTNPVFIPDRADFNSGIGGGVGDGSVSIICNSREVFTGVESGSGPFSLEHPHLFTSDGSEIFAALHKLSGTLTGLLGNTGTLFGHDIDPTILTQAETESIANIASLNIEEPKITDNLTGDITVASTLRIAGAPDEGLTNWALNVVSGAVNLSGVLNVAVSDTAIAQVAHSGAFLSDGTSNRAALYKMEGTLTGADGDTTSLFGMDLDPIIITQTAAEGVADIATLSLNAPAITKNVSGAITRAATLVIHDAPTAGNENFALIVKAGIANFRGSPMALNVSPGLNITFGSAAANTHSQFFLTGAYTSSGIAAQGTRLGFDGVLTGALGDTLLLAGLWAGCLIATQASGTIADVAQAIFKEPNVTVNGTAVVTRASTVLIEGAPDEGGQNFALLVKEGESSFGGDLSVHNVTEGRTARMAYKTAHEVHTLAAAKTSDTTTISIPAGAKLLGASFNVNTAVTDDDGDNTWSAAFITGASESLAAGAAAAQNTKVNSLTANDEVTTAITQIQFTANGSNFTAGVIEVVVYYMELTSLADV